MAAKQEDAERIIATVHGLQARWREFLKEWEKEASPPWYLGMGMGELAHYLVEKHAQGATGEFPILSGLGRSRILSSNGLEGR